MPGMPGLDSEHNPTATDHCWMLSQALVSLLSILITIALLKKEFLINIEAGIGEVDKLTISGWDEGTKRSPRNHMFVDNSCQILGNLNKQTESDVRNELKKATLSTGGAWTIA